MKIKIRDFLKVQVVQIRCPWLDLFSSCMNKKELRSREVSFFDLLHEAEHIFIDDRVNEEKELKHKYDCLTCKKTNCKR